jgi:hypothetical protein
MSWKLGDSLRTSARPFSAALAFGYVSFEDDERLWPNCPGVAISVLSLSCVGGQSKYAACERSNCPSMKILRAYQYQPTPILMTTISFQPVELLVSCCDFTNSYDAYNMKRLSDMTVRNHTIHILPSYDWSLSYETIYIAIWLGIYDYMKSRTST